MIVEQGATTGLVNVALGLKSWSVAKLCAIAISNLSIENGVEARYVHFIFFYYLCNINSFLTDDDVNLLTLYFLG